jgi:hypothetical protein
MARYYVKNPEGKWNIYSTIIDDLLFEDWIDFDEMVEEVCYELVEEKRKELASLLTDQTNLNTMTYEECMKEIEFNNMKEIGNEQ